MGTDQGFTVEEIFNLVSSVISEKVGVTNPIFEEGTEESSTAVSFKRLNQDTGFIPTIDIKESVNRIVAEL